VVGILIIELRTISIQHDWSLASRMPLVVAVYDDVVHPDRLQYVATSILCTNHQLQAWDLGFPSPHETSLESYFPKRESRVGKYLKSGVGANEPIRPDNLSDVPVIAPEPGSYLLGIRIPGPASEGKLFEPSTRVEIRPSNSTVRVEGVIAVETAERSSAAGSAVPAKAPKGAAETKGPAQAVPETPPPQP